MTTKIKRRSIVLTLIESYKLYGLEKVRRRSLVVLEASYNSSFRIAFSDQSTFEIIYEGKRKTTYGAVPSIKLVT